MVMASLAWSLKAQGDCTISHVLNSTCSSFTAAEKARLSR
jgi:hypothetical protein